MPDRSSRLWSGHRERAASSCWEQKH